MSDDKKSGAGGAGDKAAKSGAPKAGRAKAGEASKTADRSAEDAQVLGESKPKPNVAATQPATADKTTGAAKDASAVKPEAAAPPHAAAKPEPAAKPDAAKTEAAAKGAPSKPGPQAAAHGAGPKGGSRAGSAPAQRKSGGGAFAALLYALIGGLIGGGGAYYIGEMTRANTAPPAQDFATPAMVEQSIEESLAAQANDVSDAVAATGGRIDALAAEVESLRASTGGAGEVEAKVLELSDALATERTRITRLTNELAARETERVAALSAIREQVSALAAAVTATPSVGYAAERVESADANSPLAVATSAADATRLALLEGGLRRIEARVNGLSAEALPTPDLTRIDQLEQADQAFGSSIDALDGRLAAMEAATRSAVQGQAATGVAYAALAEAVAGSSPYASPLATLQEVAGLSRVDPALSDPAETGLPSDVTLATRFDEAARLGLDAAARDRRERGEAGVADRLSGLFTIRRVVEPGDESEGEAAVLARAEARIDEGDVHAALNELAALPAASREAMGDWIAAAERRAAAETAMAQLRAELLGVDR
ncbi:MAG: hypothetical protein AAGM38_11630 [Pseudomonadota bacterium]